MNNFQKLFKELKVGGKFTVPWTECDKMGLGRPEAGATACIGEKIFRFEKTASGLQVVRIK
jgi:hypothetical protein